MVSLAVKDVWGWDPESLICWTKITDASQRNAWQIGAFYAWQLFTMAVASISTLIVIAHLFRYARTTEHRIVAAHSTTTGGQHIVRAVAWRVIVYPLILIFTNCVSAAGNFTITSAGGILSGKGSHLPMPRLVPEWHQQIRPTTSGSYPAFCTD